MRPGAVGKEGRAEKQGGTWDPQKEVGEKKRGQKRVG